MNAEQEQLLKPHLSTIRGALTDAYCNAIMEPWKRDCRNALLFVGVTEDELSRLDKALEMLPKK